MQIVLTLCDRHYSREEEVTADAGTQTLKLNRREAEIDLCTACQEELAALLEQFFKDGRRPGRAIVPVAAGSTAKPSSNGSPPSAYKRAEPDTEAGEFLCRWPDGDCERKHEEHGFLTAQGRGMHERRAHNWTAAPAKDGKPKPARKRRELANA